MNIEQDFPLVLNSTKHKINLFYFHFKDFDFDAVERRQNRELLQQFTKETNLEPTHDDETKNKFYEVDAHGDDYVDFGALTGQNGAFSWHANFPLE